MPKPGGAVQLPATIPGWVIVCLFSALVVAQTIPAMLAKSATFDEVIRQLPGYMHLTVGEYRFQQDVVPLVDMLAATPLLFVDVTLPPPPDARTNWTQWLHAHDFLYRANDADRLVFLGRLAVLPLALLLGAFVFRWAERLAGRVAGCFALLLYSFEPNILAHAPLMNTDLAVACFSFLTLYFFWRAVREVTLRHMVLTGLALGLALVTKHSALWLPPTLLVLGIAAVRLGSPVAVHVLGYPRRIPTRAAERLALVVGILAVTGLIGYLVIWGIYRFRFEGGAQAGYGYPSPWEELFPNHPAARAAVLWAREARLLPEAYLYALSTFWGFLDKQPFAFLAGEISKGWWHYFLITFLLKTPLPLLIILALTPLALRRWPRERIVDLLFLSGPILVYFGIVSASRFNVGHRHLLPVYPFLFVLAGAVFPWARGQRLFVNATVAALVLWHVASSVSISPHYLAYFNELAGGPDKGHRYLVDSNLDWGQDLKGLKEYMEVHGIERVWLSYFGTASPDYHGIAYNPLPSFALFHPPRDRMPTPYVAISATNLYGLYLPVVGVDRDVFRVFRQRQPVAKIGYSIFVYELPNE